MSSPSPLTPIPLPQTLNHLLAACTRVSQLVPTAFGLPPDALDNLRGQHAHGNNNINNSNDRNGGDEDDEKANYRVYKRAIRVEYDLQIHARVPLEQLRGTMLGGSGSGSDTESDEESSSNNNNKWSTIRPTRKSLIPTRELAAVLGAGGQVLDVLERVLGELGGLYQREGQVTQEGNGSQGGSRSRNGDREREDKDKVGVARWLRHEKRGEVWDLMRGVKDLGTAIWAVLGVLESPSPTDVETSQTTLQTAVAAILGNDNDLARAVVRLHPDTRTRLRLSRLRNIRPDSFADGFSVDTPLSVSGTYSLVFRPKSEAAEDEEGEGVMVTPIEERQSQYSESEYDMLTPTSSVFNPSWEGITPQGTPQGTAQGDAYQGTLAGGDPSLIMVPISTSRNANTPRTEAHETSTHSPVASPPTPAFVPNRRRSMLGGALRVVSVSPSGVDFLALPQDHHPRQRQRPVTADGSTSPTTTSPTTPTITPPVQPHPISADTIFHLPEITDTIVLSFFRRALRVSYRYAALYRTYRMSTILREDDNPNPGFNTLSLSLDDDNDDDTDGEIDNDNPTNRDRRFSFSSTLTRLSTDTVTTVPTRPRGGGGVRGLGLEGEGMAARAGRQAMQGLGARAWREMCTDVYDELVRRNVADREGRVGHNQNQNRGEQLGGQLGGQLGEQPGQQGRARSVGRNTRGEDGHQHQHQQGMSDTHTHTQADENPDADPGTAHFSPNRLTARRKFAAMADGPFGEFVVLVLEELERRCTLVTRAERQPQRLFPRRVQVHNERVHDDGWDRRDGQDRQDEQDEDVQEDLAYQASRVRECDAAGQLGRMSVSAVRGAVVA
ncbi:hypothetical protein B0J18DRAFT_414332 [Chaetomium sp. MPI-SDFR-AT-0129]|nr:hypothetical protein B0J18DRAFT_414332 [Chaetomium sp. MPI-SDFR-AT-0129]